MNTRFEVIVIGGGHAGTEAALAAARMGCDTLLLSHSLDTLGQMSCNPAIGGIGKSHLVKEVDALGGAMALATDQAGIQFRTLNGSRGAAVRATRAQADRVLYRRAIRGMLQLQSGLTLVAQAVQDLILEGDRVQGVVGEQGDRFYAPTVVLTTGTFLGGRIHIGPDSRSGGRADDPAAVALAQRLRELPLRVGRLKTGTPPRLVADTVDLELLQEQWGDERRPVMSFLGDASQHPRQCCCWITHTNEATHEVIHQGLTQSPLFSGAIAGTGPRYCPSVEDKVHRFADKPSHQIFVEPEGLSSGELYPNGISTSLPLAVQERMVHSIRGFERARISRPGYAIEYDFFDPRDLQHSLQSKLIGGLYFAGQINGTTGYEEAAAQGLLAGINAALQVRAEPPWCPRRDEAYIGVLVDDLISLGTREPYRMFTSRAEYRLLLRQDNADIRLTERGRSLGLVGEERWRRFREKTEGIAAEQRRLADSRVLPGTEAAQKLAVKLGKPLERAYSLAELLKRPELDYPAVAGLLGEAHPDPQVAEQVEIQAKYAGYLARQQDDIERLRRFEHTSLPQDLDFQRIDGLSNEVRQQLSAARPATLARASRLPGVTPAAISLLLIHLKKRGAPLRRSA